MRAKLSTLMLSLLLVMAFVATPAAQARPATLTAWDLRVLLTQQLQEHTVLASMATGAALGGRDAEFKAAADALDKNSVDLSKSIGTVYGADAEKAFLPLWRSHIGFFVDYTQGVAAKDQAKQDKAVADLTQYANDFGAFLAGANPNLTKDGVAKLVTEHVLTLKDVVDAQAAGDQPKAFAELREAYAHMDMIASPLAGAIAKQFPDKFAGDADAAGSKLRTTLLMGLQEHTVLAAAATNAALGGRDAEFKAAAGELDKNSVDLSKAIGSVYGADAEKAFLPLWRSHIGFFVDYTQGVAAKDQAKQDKAVADLTQYANDFGAFLAGANPNLTKDGVAKLVTEHVLTLKDVVDAQAAGDQPKAFAELREAYAHMDMIASPLADAIVKQFPAKFPVSGTNPVPATMPNTGAGDTHIPWLPLVTLAAGMIGLGVFAVTRNRRPI